MSAPAEHPSNKLYRGEAETFQQAMALVVRECEYEIARGGNVVEFDAHPDRYRPLTPAEREHYTRDDEQTRASFETYRDAARRALEIYRKHLDAAERAAVAEMRATGGDDMQMIADALEAGEYSGLAI